MYNRRVQWVGLDASTIAQSPRARQVKTMSSGIAMNFLRSAGLYMSILWAYTFSSDFYLAVCIHSHHDHCWQQALPASSPNVCMPVIGIFVLAAGWIIECGTQAINISCWMTASPKYFCGPVRTLSQFPTLCATPGWKAHELSGHVC